MKINNEIIEGTEFFTMRFIAEQTGKKYGAVKAEFSFKGIRAICDEKLFNKAAYEHIENLPGKGRPKKAAETKTKKPKK